MSLHSPNSLLARREMLGLAALLGVSLIAPLGGCAFEPAERLSGEDLDLMGEVAEVIIPTTDTIGAKAAGVVDFARMMVSDWFVTEERLRFMAGLKAFDDNAMARYGHSFVKLGGTQKHAMVGSHLAKEESAPILSANPSQAMDKTIPANPTGMLQPPVRRKPPFILLMKRLTVLGYYTSEAGATQELELNIVPGSYTGCGTMDPHMHEGVNLGLRNPTFSAS